MAKSILVWLIALTTMLSLTACHDTADDEVSIPSETSMNINDNPASQTANSINESSSASPCTVGWHKDALMKELYNTSSYSAVYSQMVDTYLIACGLYYDFNSPYLFSSDMKVNYQETIEYFLPFKSHAFVQELGSYIEESNANSSTNVIVPLLQYAISMKEHGVSNGNIQSYIFQTDESFYSFLENLQQFYVDTQAEKFFANSEIHKQFEQYIHASISTVPIEAYINMIEKYTGTIDIIFGDSMLHYTSCLSVYKSPYNATFHQCYINEDIYLVIFQSPLGYDGSFDITNTIETTVHESLHQFINPGVEQQQGLIHSLSNDKNPDDYAASNYTWMPWHRLTDEAIVRVVQARIYGAVSQNYETAAKQILDEEVRSGWANLNAMYDILENYETKREQYPQIDSFLPILISQYFGEK